MVLLPSCDKRNLGRDWLSELPDLPRPSWAWGAHGTLKSIHNKVILYHTFIFKPRSDREPRYLADVRRLGSYDT